MNEFDLIAKYFSRTPRRRDVLLGVGDDAAVLSVPPNSRLVAAVDTIVEGVHFPVSTNPAAIAHRALAVNLSDMAAMGADPAWFTLSLSLPQSDARWLEDFSRGLYSIADAFGVELVGGDTVRGGLSISVQILGLVEADRWLTRSGAKAGDLIFVSGCPGEAAAGLAVLQREMQLDSSAAQLVKIFEWPQPRVRLGRVLRTLASSAIDISDGLLGDLRHICEQSTVGAVLDINALPRSDAMYSLFNKEERSRFALLGGDDYELLFTISPDRVPELRRQLPDDCPVTQIGRIVDLGSSASDSACPVVCFEGDARIEIESRGYDHFARTE